MTLDINALSKMANEKLVPLKMNDPVFEQKRRIADELQRRISCNDKIVAVVNIDGTVSIYEKKPSIIRKAGEWENIRAISIGHEHIVGLRYDNTLVAVGKNDKLNKQCEVSSYKNVEAICCGYSDTLMLRKGLVADTNDHTLYDNTRKVVEGVVQIGCDGFEKCALIKNGTVFMEYRFRNDRDFDVSQWTDVVQIACNHSYVLGLKKDGTVLVTGKESRTSAHNEIREWRNIVSIACDSSDASGLHADGTVVRTSGNLDGWRNIVAIGSTTYSFYGVDKNGSILFRGDDPIASGSAKYKLFESVSDLFSEIAESRKLCLKKIELSKQYQKDNLCPYCGGKYSGLFSKTCVTCGKKKAY